MAAHQPPPSLGFSRQEHWSGLPFPSPMRESEVALSCPTLATPWTVAYQNSPSIGFSRQEYWSGLPFLLQGIFPSPGIEPRSPALQTDALPSEPSLNSFWFSWIVIDSQERAFRIIESVNSIHLVSAKAIKTYKTLALCTCALIARPSVVVIYCLNFCQSDGNYLILYC